MRVSPLDIRKQEFTRTFRGYEIEEVQSFLQMLSKEWEEMRDEHRRLEEQLRGMEDKIRHYERVEEALQEALQTARDSARKTVQNAEEKARNIINSAEARAGEIQGEATARREKLREENSRLINRQHELVARLRAFLTSEIEMLERYESNQLVGSRSSEVEKEPERSSPRQSPSAQARPSAVSQRIAPQSFRDEDEPEEETNYSFEDAHEEPDDSERLDPRSFNVRSLINTSEKSTDWDDEEISGGDSAEESDEPVSPEAVANETDPDDNLSEREKTKARQATEEIEKIRRILNDLD